MMKQVVVRTYPLGYSPTTEYLEKYLNDGFNVVMVTKFMVDKDREGNEYILEKEVDEK